MYQFIIKVKRTELHHCDLSLFCLLVHDVTVQGTRINACSDITNVVL